VVKKGEKLEHFDGSGHAVGMQTTTIEPMEPSEQFCPNPACSARGQKGLGNIAIPDRKRQRYRCAEWQTSREMSVKSSLAFAVMSVRHAKFAIQLFC